MTTIYRQGYLKGESKRSEDVLSLTQGQYDLAIISPSWDTRCLSLVEAAELRAEHGIILSYDVRDSQGLREKYDDVLLGYMKSHTEKLTRVCGPSVDVENLWPRLFSEIKRVREAVGRPLRLFLDLSTFSRFYAMAVLSNCFNHMITKGITLFYAEGVYETGRESLHEVAFSRGRWRSVTIPSLEGSYDPGKKKYYLVSVGFEGIKTLQVISREDPDRISVLFPNPGFLPDYVRRTEKANRMLIDRFKVPEREIVNATAGDAIEAWKKLSEAKVERPQDENIYYLCCGTKPHAVGLALRGLCLGYPAVLYRVPTEHAVVDVKPSGTYWRFDITDLSTPSPFSN